MKKAKKLFIQSITYVERYMGEGALDDKLIQAGGYRGEHGLSLWGCLGVYYWEARELCLCYCIIPSVDGIPHYP